MYVGINFILKFAKKFARVGKNSLENPQFAIALEKSLNWSKIR